MRNKMNALRQAAVGTLVPNLYDVCLKTMKLTLSSNGTSNPLTVIIRIRHREHRKTKLCATGKGTGEWLSEEVRIYASFFQLAVEGLQQSRLLSALLELSAKVRDRFWTALEKKEIVIEINAITEQKALVGSQELNESS